MRILVGNIWLQKTGSSENFTFALATTLKRMGHNVEYFTFNKGEISERLEQAGIPFMCHDFYDLILANHITVVEHLYLHGFIVQTCHGAIVEMEQPSPYADKYVGVTEEVCCHLRGLGVNSDLILNGIDCNRFSPKRDLPSKLTKVLSLCQSDEINVFLKDCCNEIGVDFTSCNKHTDNVFEIEKEINKADLVIGIGRSLYDAMACGRCVISYDRRDYVNQSLGDGYINKENIERSIFYNCSGRGSRKNFSKEEFIAELKKYNPEDGKWARDYALNFLNMEKSAKRYLGYYNTFNDNLQEILHKKLQKVNEKSQQTINRLTETFYSTQKAQNNMVNNEIVTIKSTISSLQNLIESYKVQTTQLQNTLIYIDKKRRKYLCILRCLIYIVLCLIGIFVTFQLVVNIFTN